MSMYGHHPHPHHHPHPAHDSWIDTHRAADCDDQLPNISRVGRGPKGDSLEAIMWSNQDDSVVRLQVKNYDGQTGQLKSSKMSENLSGGYITFEPHYDEMNSTMTLEFKYIRPAGKNGKIDRSWRWISPPIPFTGEKTYVGDVDDDELKALDIDDATPNEGGE